MEVSLPPFSMQECLRIVVILQAISTFEKKRMQKYERLFASVVSVVEERDLAKKKTP